MISDSKTPRPLKQTILLAIFLGFVVMGYVCGPYDSGAEERRDVSAGSDMKMGAPQAHPDHWNQNAGRHQADGT
jgi:hypothetical protein